MIIACVLVITDDVPVIKFNNNIINSAILVQQQTPDNMP